MERKIVYISGWLGKGPLSKTCLWLKKYYPHVDYVSPCDYGTDFLVAIAQMERLVQPADLIVANSYGCFVANTFRHSSTLHFDNEMVWINPCLYPSIELSRLSPDSVTTADIKRFATYEQQNKVGETSDKRHLVHLVCSEKDDVIADYKADKFSTHPAILIPNGLHKLTDEQRDVFVKPLIDAILNGSH